MIFRESSKNGQNKCSSNFCGCSVYPFIKDTIKILFYFSQILKLNFLLHVNLTYPKLQARTFAGVENQMQVSSRLVFQTNISISLNTSTAIVLPIILVYSGVVGLFKYLKEHFLLDFLNSSILSRFIMFPNSLRKKLAYVNHMIMAKVRTSTLQKFDHLVKFVVHMHSKIVFTFISEFFI